MLIDPPLYPVASIGEVREFLAAMDRAERDTDLDAEDRRNIVAARLEAERWLRRKLAA